MPGLKLEYPGPVDSDWTRVQLVANATTCEAGACKAQALHAHVGVKHVVYLCDEHMRILRSNPRMARTLEQGLFIKFNEQFNFIDLVHQTWGGLLSSIEERDAAVDAAVKSAAMDAAKALRELRRDMQRYYAKQAKQVKIGAPDDGLIHARTGHSPLRESNRPVLRSTEQPLVPIVLLGTDR